MDMDYEELASVLGESEGDDRVRNIIYGSMAGSSVSFMVDDLDFGASGVYPSVAGGDFRRVAPSDGRSDYYDAVMDHDMRDSVSLRMMDKEELGHGDYRASVDIEEIERLADNASVDS